MTIFASQAATVEFERLVEPAPVDEKPFRLADIIPGFRPIEEVPIPLRGVKHPPIKHPSWCQQWRCTVAYYNADNLSTTGAHKSPEWGLSRDQDAGTYVRAALWACQQDVPKGHPDYSSGRYVCLTMGEYEYLHSTEPTKESTHEYDLTPTMARALAAELMRLADAADAALDES
jgi:hypothetical protein